VCARKSVGSVSSVIYVSLTKRFFQTHRPPMKRIQRICTDSPADLIASEMPGTCYLRLCAGVCPC